MIRSKFTAAVKAQAIFICIFFMICLILIIQIIIENPFSKFDAEFILLNYPPILILILYLLWALPIYHNTNQITIDIVSQSITFRNRITSRTASYNLNEFDGIIDSMEINAYDTSHVTYLIKDGKYFKKISPRNYANYQEILSGFAAIRKLGYRKLNFIDKSKLLFGLNVYV